jgi:hypothetical protein
MAAFKYRAFLSYSHRDAVWAKWLHRALESYRIDKDLIGCNTPLGPLPKTLRPKWWRACSGSFAMAKRFLKRRSNMVTAYRNILKKKRIRCISMAWTM